MNKLFINDRKILIDKLEIDDILKIKSTPNNYDVLFQKENTYDTINNTYKLNDILVIDRNIYNNLNKNLKISQDKIFICEANEDFKTLDGVQKLLNFLQMNNFTKGETLIAVGGGVIQDISSFVSCIYKRGINWTLIPTTLLSMSDSCIGSKSCINYNNSKNQLGVFYAPTHIIININFLKTLSKKDIKSGLGEILRLCATGGNIYIDMYCEYVDKGEVTDFTNFKKLIYTALLIKKSVIEIDQYEKNIRKGLNYGHTLGHSLEKISNYEIPHGIAVSFGMIIINKLFIKKENSNINLLNNLCYDLCADINISKYNLDELEIVIKKDKKIISNNLTLVYLTNFGNMLFHKKEVNKEFIDELKEIIYNL